LPNFLKKGFFEFYIDENILRCQFPDGDGYQLNMCDIIELEKYIVTSSNTWVDYKIKDNKGREYLVPTQFALSPYKVFAEIQKHRPELKVAKSSNR
jgi:hypothetical protein